MSKAEHSFRIKTTDGTGEFNFFTTAQDHKKALAALLTNSSDFKNIVHSDRDLQIIVERLKSEPKKDKL